MFHDMKLHDFYAYCFGASIPGGPVHLGPALRDLIELHRRRSFAHLAAEENSLTSLFESSRQRGGQSTGETGTNPRL